MENSIAFVIIILVRGIIFLWHSIPTRRLNKSNFILNENKCNLWTFKFIVELAFVKDVYQQLRIYCLRQTVVVSALGEGSSIIGHPNTSSNFLRLGWVVFLLIVLFLFHLGSHQMNPFTETSGSIFWLSIAVWQKPKTATWSPVFLETGSLKQQLFYYVYDFEEQGSDGEFLSSECIAAVTQRWSAGGQAALGVPETAALPLTGLTSARMVGRWGSAASVNQSTYIAGFSRS